MYMYHIAEGNCGVTRVWWVWDWDPTMVATWTAGRRSAHGGVEAY